VPGLLRVTTAPPCCPLWSFLNIAKYTITADAEDLPRIDDAQPPSIALHVVEHDHLVTHWRVV
jgi:hypothetical protein